MKASPSCPHPLSSFYGRTACPSAANVATFAVLAAGGVGLWRAFGDPAQWGCVALGLYVVATMAQRLKAREPDAFALIFMTPSLRLATLGFSFLSFTGYVISFWTAQFFIRYHGFSVSEIGDRLGVISAVGGGLGVTLGGALADRFRIQTPAGRLIVGMMNALIPIPLLLLALSTRRSERGPRLLRGRPGVRGHVAGRGQFHRAGSRSASHAGAGLGGLSALRHIVVGLALGPYVVGRLSDLWGDLRLAFMAATSANLVAFVFFVMAARTIARDEETRVARAAAARA